MNGTRKPNAMLIELVIVILFFSISAGIILQLFVAANERGHQNDVDNTAMLLAEDVAERLAVSTQTLDAFFMGDGWVQKDDAYVRQESAYAGRRLQLTARGATEEREAGTLDSVELTIYDGDRAVLSMPVARYLPMEVTP